MPGKASAGISSRSSEPAEPRDDSYDRPVLLRPANVVQIVILVLGILVFMFTMRDTAIAGMDQRMEKQLTKYATLEEVRGLHRETRIYIAGEFKYLRELIARKKQ